MSEKGHKNIKTVILMFGCCAACLCWFSFVVFMSQRVFACDTSVNDKRTNKPLKPAALMFSREVILAADRRCLLGERAEGEGHQVLLLS